MSEIMKYKELSLSPIDNQEERLIDDALSILKSMGMMDKYDKDQQRGFIRSCMAYKLNPILKEIYPMPFYNSETKTYNLGVCPDYKSFLDRAESSGVWDGYEVEYSGDVMFKTIQKDIKKKDGSTFRKTAKIVDPASTLQGIILIYRKDWSRPLRSRPLFLVQVMKDTDFWHSDPYGMLEKQLIRTFFPRAFPKQCAIRDDSIEADMHYTPETPQYEVIESKPAVDKVELAQALKDAKMALYNIPLVSSESAQIKTAMDTMFKEQNLDGLKAITQQLENRLQEMQKVKAEEVQQNRPETAPEQDESIETKAKAMIKEVLDALVSKGKSRVYVRNSLKKHLGIESELDDDWNALLWAAPFDIDRYREAYSHWKKELDTAPSKLRKEAISLCLKSDEAEVLLDMLDETSEEELPGFILNLKGGESEE